jgi:hypothetical protein
MTAPQRQPVAWPLAAGGVLVMVLVVLAALVVVRRGERPVTAPSAPIVPTALTAVEPTAISTTAPAFATAVAPPLAKPAATAAPITPAAPPTAVPAAASATDQATGSAKLVRVEGTPRIMGPGTAAPTPPSVAWWNDERSVPRELVSEIEQAYNRFWDVRGQAFLDANPEPLADVMDGKVLQNDLAAMRALQAQGRAQRIEVRHNARILHAGPDEAAIEDDYVSTVVDVDAITKKPVESTTPGAWQIAYRMRKVDGTWKVVDAVRLVDA